MDLCWRVRALENIVFRVSTAFCSSPLRQKGRVPIRNLPVLGGNTETSLVPLCVISREKRFHLRHFADVFLEQIRCVIRWVWLWRVVSKLGMSEECRGNLGRSYAYMTSSQSYSCFLRGIFFVTVISHVLWYHQRKDRCNPSSLNVPTKPSTPQATSDNFPIPQRWGRPWL